MEHVEDCIGSNKNVDENLISMIKEGKQGYLYSDSYGNIGRLLIKPRPIDTL